MKGSRSGSGKIVYEHWDTFISIWGVSPSTLSLQFGVESHDFPVVANLESMDNINLTDSDSDLVPESHCSPVNPSSSELSEPHTNSSNVSEITCGTGSEESTSSGRSEKRKTSPCPALIDQKRKHFETFSCPDRSCAARNVKGRRCNEERNAASFYRKFQEV